MSMIFDRFPNVEQAEAFRAEVKKQCGLDGQLFVDAAEAYAEALFADSLHPPVVTIDDRPLYPDSPEPEPPLSKAWDEWIRPVIEKETQVDNLVEEFGGTAAGT